MYRRKLFTKKIYAQERERESFKKIVQGQGILILIVPLIT